MAFDKEEKINENAAVLNEKIIYDGLEMKVIAVYNNSVAAEFLEFPVKGREADFPYSRTAVNHKNYKRTHEILEETN
ncbi:DUF2187 family protein [Halalkalibacter okhensis]|uniref:Uncharacterized protein n=1 Tax=Halalkalibacter okhensis TaxID=333138 RepID=A0A0B0IFB3_9BACI|nr:DUF2187 family protein [Halalkalibacter okhensis]KHF41268.1 hypothetical protein LQ50_05795 [Halalkalibacter okhensis]